MPQLTFLQSVADKASRLLPCSFTEIVEETTSDVLTAPDYENIMFICDQTNARPDNAHEVVMAVRRRIDNANPKVKYFTVLLLDALIKNCYEDLHNEVADTPALQNCLVDIACLTPIQDGELEAKKASLQLILNMSYWFIGATEDKTKMLSKLADEVRQKTSPLAFEDIEADAAFQLKRAPPNRHRAPNATSNQQQAAAYRVSRNQNHNPSSSSSSFTAGSHGHGRASRPTSGGGGGSPAPVRVVDAIPVFQYTEQEISGMLDSCMLLSEMINTAEEEKRSVMGDEIVTSIAVQVRRDHRKLAILLSSGAQMNNLDVLLSVADSQMAIVQRLSDLVARDGQRLRDVASIGADEDDAAAAAIEHSRREANPAQITRNNPSNATPEELSGREQQQQQQHEHQRKPRQGDLDNDYCPQPLPIPAPGHRTMGGQYEYSQSTAVAAATNPSPSTAAVTAVVDAHQQQQPKKPIQDLDDFFGGPTSSSSSHPPSSPPVSSTTIHSSAAPTATTASDATAETNAVTATTPAPSEATNSNGTTQNASPLNTDFFDEGNNAPSAGVNAKPFGSLNNNATTEGGDDEFDAFLSSRLK